MRATDPRTQPRGGGKVRIGKHAKGRHKYMGQVVRRAPKKAKADATDEPAPDRAPKTLLEKAEAGEWLSQNEIRKVQRMARKPKKATRARGAK